jgi:hypothetical protein
MTLSRCQICFCVQKMFWMKKCQQQQTPVVSSGEQYQQLVFLKRLAWGKEGEISAPALVCGGGKEE